MGDQMNPVAKSIFKATLDAMQTAEEITGDMPLDEYEVLMASIAQEACQRLVNCRVFRGEHPRVYLATRTRGHVDLNGMDPPDGSYVLVKVDPNGN